jgi:hypothetical protein
MAKAEEIRALLEDHGLPQHGATPLELACAREYNPYFYMNGKKYVDQTVVDGPERDEVLSWLAKHADCEARAKASKVRFQVVG